VPEHPVVDTKTGYVYEKTLIEKYLQEKGTCPMTGNEMTKDDLLPLKMGKPIKPRHSPQMSIPGILGMLHNVIFPTALPSSSYFYQFVTNYVLQGTVVELFV
jgi:U-box domain